MGEPRLQLIRRGGWTEDVFLMRMKPPFGPRNMWSNLAYGMVGIGLAFIYQDLSSSAMALSLILLMTGSALYHGYKTLYANHMDWLGMYAVFGALAAHGFAPEEDWISWIMLGAGAVLGWIYAEKMHWVSMDWHMGALLVVASVGPVLERHWPLLAISWGLFIIAFTIWHLDKAHHKLVGLWGHALWHILTAIAIGVMYVAQA